MVALKKPAEIKRSPFGIGAETLDRGLWKPSEVYPWMTDLPVKWARLQTGWARTEQQKGVYDWGWLDEAVDGLLQRGIEPFFNLGYGNPLYTEGGARYHPMVNEAALAGWKAFVHRLVERYHERISHWEIWNEPNLRQFWLPTEPDPEVYVELVRQTVPVIRDQAPESTLIGGVTSRLPSAYIRRMFEAGLAGHIDIFSFHPYGTIPERYAPAIQTLQRLIHRYKPGMPIWQGEQGFPSDPNSTGFSGAPPWTENIQAKVMLRRLLTDLSLDMAVTLWFIIIDLHDYPAGSGKVNYKGILRARPEIRPKVAYRALQNLGSLIFGEVKRQLASIYTVDGAVPLDDTFWDAVHQVSWPDNPKVWTTALDTGNGPVLAYWMTGKPQDVRPFGDVHLLYQDWDGKSFTDPVLIDPLTGKIMALPPASIHMGVGRTEAQVFENLPLADYPLLIMQREQVLS